MCVRWRLLSQRLIEKEKCAGKERIRSKNGKCVAIASQEIQLVLGQKEVSGKAVWNHCVSEYSGVCGGMANNFLSFS